MCQAAWVDDIKVETVGDLQEVLQVELVRDPVYQNTQIENTDCLCSIDVQASFEKAGLIVVKQDHWGDFHAIRPYPAR